MTIPPLLATFATALMVFALCWYLYDRHLMRQAVKMVARQTSRLDKLGVDPEAQLLIDRMQLVAHLEPEDMEWLDSTGATWHRNHDEEIEAGVQEQKIDSGNQTLVDHWVSLNKEIRQLKEASKDMETHAVDLGKDTLQVPVTSEKNARALWNIQVLDQWQEQADWLRDSLFIFRDITANGHGDLDTLLTDLDKIVGNISSMKKYLCSDHRTSRAVRDRVDKLHVSAIDTLNSALEYRDMYADVAKSNRKR